VRFVDRRSRRLKGVAEAVVVYRVESQDGEPAAGTPKRSARSRPVLNTRGARLATASVVLLVVAASVFLVLRGISPTDAPRSSFGSSAGPPATGAAASPDPDDGDLLAQIPSGIRDRCKSTQDAAERMGTLASARCDLELSADAETVWYDAYETLGQLSGVLAELVLSQRLPRAECGPQVARGQGNWRVGSTHSGRLLCYAADGRSWIVWSYDAERITARAVRGGAATEDWLALYAWWDQVRLFLR
jgi:hypothetical protein